MNWMFYLPQHPDIGLKHRNHDISVKTNMVDDFSHSIFKFIKLSKDLITWLSYRLKAKLTGVEECDILLQ